MILSFNAASLLSLVFLVRSVVNAESSVHASRLSIGKNNCVVKASGINTTDDTPSFIAALKQCGNGSTIAFRKGVNYNIFTPIVATNLLDVEIKIEGNLHLPQNITYVQGIVNTTSVWFTFQGQNVHLTGTNDISTGWIESHGQAWWDANPAKGTGLASRPHLLTLKASTGTMTYFKSRKPIAWNVVLQGNDITVKHSFIDATTTGAYPFNTDGFGVQATNVLIEDSIILNGDDAFAITNGAADVVVRNALIGGPSCHGTSIGSLGKNQGDFVTVKNILFENVTAINSLYGARFKSWVGGQGLAQNVTWQNYKIHNVTFPIYVTQTYIDQSVVGSGRVNNSTVLMRDFKWLNWRGDINTYKPGDGSCVTDPCWYDVPGADGTQSIIMQCSNTTSCADFEVRDTHIIPQSLKSPTVLCNNLQNSSSLGFLCVNGTFVGTH